MCVCVRLSVRHRIFESFLLFVYLSTFILGRALRGSVRDVDAGFRAVRIVRASSVRRPLSADCTCTRMCIHIAAASSSALSHSVVPLVTKMHVDERTGMCLLLLLKSLYPRASSQRRGVPPRLCVFV